MELSHDEEQRRLRDAAKCDRCKKIWATYSNQFCNRHKVQNWKLRGKNTPEVVTPSSESGSNPNLNHAIDLPIHDLGTSNDPNVDNPSSLEYLTSSRESLPNSKGRFDSPESIARDLGMSDDQIRRALKVLGIRVPPRFASFQHNAGGGSWSDITSNKDEHDVEVAANRQKYDLAQFEDQTFKDVSIASEFGTSFKFASFTRCLFERVDFQEVNLSASRFLESRFVECTFTRTVLFNCVFESSALMDCQFEWARLEGANFKGSLVASNFRNARLIDASFCDAILTSSNLRGSLLVGVNFDNADLRGAIFDRANTQAARLERATFDFGQFTQDQVTKSRTPRLQIDSQQRQHLNEDGTAKKSFLSLNEANQAATRLQAEGDLGVKAYQCKICRNYHIAH